VSQDAPPLQNVPFSGRALSAYPSRQAVHNTGSRRAAADW
jgi:hypothetical protein